MSAAAYLVIGLVTGSGLGLLIGWLWASARRASADDPLCQELRQQVAAREADLSTLREEFQQSASARSAAEAARDASADRAQALEADLATARQDFAGARERCDRLREEMASAAAQLESTRKQLDELSLEKAESRQALAYAQEKLRETEKQNTELASKSVFLEERLSAERALIQELQSKFAKDFESVANKLLVENSSRFGQQSVETLDKLLGPLRENLHDFKARLENAHKDTIAHHTLLKDQIGRIGTEAANLSKALKGDVKVLGNWGENMLDLILEKSGLQEGLHYRRQASAQNEDGETRFLDVIIDLPDNKHLVIDSKVSLKCYEECMNCVGEGSRLAALQAHVDCLRGHFRNLSGKRYHAILGISAPDFVLMYIPIEAAFFAGVSHDPSIVSEALDRNVVLTTNSTLLATLRTVAHVWRLADQHKYALKIADRGSRLYVKFASLLEDLMGVSESLQSSQSLMSEAIRKLKTGPGNLVRQIEMLKELGVKASKNIPSEMLESEDDGMVQMAPLPKTPNGPQPELLGFGDAGGTGSQRPSA